MPTDPAVPSLTPFPTGINTLDTLLSRPGNSAEYGFAHLAQVGFFGIIFGASCSGKSVFTLELACRFVRRTKDGQDAKCHAVFVTQEPTALIIERAMHSFDFLDRQTIQDCADGCENLDPEQPGKLWIFQMDLDEKRQERTLRDIFTLINGAFCCDKKDLHGTEADTKRRLLVCVDNAETICTEAFEHLMGHEPGASPQGLKRPPNFYKTLRGYCRQHRLRAWFSFEEDAAQRRRDETPQIATAAQTYAADAVIRLGSAVQVGDYFRERSLEIVKARDQFYRRGRHHFTIRGEKGSFASPEAVPADGKKGVVVFPSLPTQLHRLSREAVSGTPKGRALQLGIGNVDKAVTVKNDRDPKAGYLAPGTVAVLVADLDAFATEIALHFAITQAEASENMLYLSFHHTEEHLQSIVAQYENLRSPTLHSLHFPPEHISESKLLHDIDAALPKAQEGRPCLVVVDNLLALGKKFPLLRDPEHFVAALFQLFRRRGLVALVVDDVEVGEGRNPLDRSFAAGLAQHVFLLRHVEFQTRIRRIFSVLKFTGLREPGELWELIHEDGELTADSERLDFFKGLLSGKPEPVQVAMSLYADSPESPLHLYLRTQQKVLSQIFGKHIKIHTHHPDAYLALQQSVSQHGLPVLGDCHIISVDEIWLDELMARDCELLVSFTHADWDETPYVTVAHDLACTRHGYDPKKNFAIPERNNCGVLAIQTEMRGIAAEVPGMETVLAGLWKDSWPLDSAPKWESLADLQTAFTRGHPKLLGRAAGADYRAPESPNDVDRHWAAFTFSMENRESCVSFLLEVVLSRLQEEENLLEADGQLSWTAGNRAHWLDGLVLALRLLDPWDLHRLADCWYRPARAERRALFSRQWFSSWGCLGLRFPGIRYVELPKGNAKTSTPVSGAWYLGMLRQSSAIRSGQRLIERLTHETEELHRLNYGIGLPVRAELYQEAATKSGGPLRARQSLPYAEAFASKSWKPRADGLQTRLDDVVRSKCPFYRPAILRYAAVSPVLMGLFTKSAAVATSPELRSWLLGREDEGVLRERLGSLLSLAEKECNEEVKKG